MSLWREGFGVGELPFSVRHKSVVEGMIPFIASKYRSFLHDMVVKAERDADFANVFEPWLECKESTVYLRDEVMPLMKPLGDAKVAVQPKYCTCCNERHGETTYRDWDYFHDTPWVALDSAQGRISFHARNPNGGE